MTVKAEKYHQIPSTSWKLREAGGVIPTQVQKLQEYLFNKIYFNLIETERVCAI